MDDVWKYSVDSSVSHLYVEPLYPKTGQQVEIRIQVGLHCEVTEVLLFSFYRGSEHPQTCTVEQLGKRKIYSASLEMPDEPLRWYFVLLAPDRAYYYSLLGVSASVPSLRDSFSLKPDLVPVSWVGGSTCYQIFPDRFREGDPQVGAVSGSYSFDGAPVQSLPFHEKPLSFEEGRCLDFFNGDLKGIEDAIPHFKALGVNVLYLNPIGVSRTTHRYDCCDFFHVDEKLGGDEAFLSLCRVLHEHGIRIIVDISINHTGTEHPWLLAAQRDRGSEEAAFYYFDEDGSVACWNDVPTLPQLNYSSPRLRDIIYRGEQSVLRKFLKEPFLQDGWRLDVAPEVGRRGKDQFCEEVWREVRTAVKEENEQAYLVGEDWLDASPFLQGDMWDGSMNYLGCSRPLRSWMGESDRFLSEGWGHDPKPTRAYTGLELAQALESQLAGLPAQMWPMQMNLIDSHDTTRLHANPTLFNFSVYSGCIMLMYLQPGMSCLYYGDEIGLEGPYGSVEASRYPMKWDKNAWDDRFYSLYTSLGALRTSYAQLLKEGAHKVLYADEQSLVFARYDHSSALLAVLNKRKDAHTVRIPNLMLQATTATGSKSGDVVVSEEALLVKLEGGENCIIECRR